MAAYVPSVGVGEVVGGGAAQSDGAAGGTAVDAEDRVYGVEHMGGEADGGEADACDRSQGVHTVAAAEHCGGLDDVIRQIEAAPRLQGALLSL